MELQLRWPEEVVTTTMEVSVLVQQLADLSTMFAGLNKFTIPQLKSCYGEQWKQRYPSFKYGKNKQELVTNLVECYTNRASEVLRLVKPKKNLFTLFDSLKCHPTITAKGEGIGRTERDTAEEVVKKLILLVTTPEKESFSSSSVNETTAGHKRKMEEQPTEKEKGKTEVPESPDKKPRISQNDFDLHQLLSQSTKDMPAYLAPLFILVPPSYASAASSSSSLSSSSTVPSSSSEASSLSNPPCSSATSSSSSSSSPAHKDAFKGIPSSDDLNKRKPLHLIEYAMAAYCQKYVLKMEAIIESRKPRKGVQWMEKLRELLAVLEKKFLRPWNKAPNAATLVDLKALLEEYLPHLSRNEECREIISTLVAKTVDNILASAMLQHDRTLLDPKFDVNTFKDRYIEPLRTIRDCQSAVSSMAGTERTFLLSLLSFSPPCPPFLFSLSLFLFLSFLLCHLSLSFYRMEPGNYKKSINIFGKTI
ncbi:14-3-3 protein, variant 3 [Balamuthia mandrillaris]